MIAALSLLSGLLFLYGCGKDETSHVGIDIEAGESVREQTKESARERIASLVSLYFSKKGQSISNAECGQLSEKILNITLDEGLSDMEYMIFLELLKERGEELANSLAALSSFDEKAIESLVSIYFELACELDSDFFGDVAYGICLIGYDRNIEKRLESGTAYGKLVAEQLTEEKRIMVEHIGKESFCELVGLFGLSRGLFTDAGFELSSLESFTDSEILTFLRRVDISKIGIDSEGYKLLIDYYCDSMLTRETGYFEELIYEANKNGDAQLMAEDLPKLLSLISKALKLFDKEDIALIRSSDRKGLVGSLFEKFGEEELALFEELTEREYNSESYERVAVLFHGEDFEVYRESMSASSFEELLSAVGTDGFYNILEGYIFGISPAFSYGMRE